MRLERLPICCILPPHILNKLAESPEHRERAFRTLAISEKLRGRREVFAQMAIALPAGQKRRTIYDAQQKTDLPGNLVRGEDVPVSNDPGVNEAYDFSGATYDFYKEAYNRNSLDDQEMRLDSTVHYGQEYDNAFWDGRQMVYGDGDSRLFQRFTICLDVVAHELTHGLTSQTAKLLYTGQPGALNESISDVFGSLVKQRALAQTADKADWLIGAGLFTAAVSGVALRSMKDPGTAYDDPALGKDPQPGHMSGYQDPGSDVDHGGVHINSGIPNRAFFLTAAAIGGNAWEKAGLIWYTALKERLQPNSDFQAAADATFAVARDLFGENSSEQRAVRDGWSGVGITVGAAAVVAGAPKPPAAAAGRARGTGRAATS